MIFYTNSAEETIALGKKIGSMLQAGDVIAMQGTLAAGKTTITKGIASALDIKDTVTSPTFCLVSEYEGKMLLYHIDAYRLNDAEDFINLGADEMIYGHGVTVIEWSEKVMSELPSSTIIIRIEPKDSGNGSAGRKITVENWPYGEL